MPQETPAPFPIDSDTAELIIEAIWWTRDEGQAMPEMKDLAQTLADHFGLKNEKRFLGQGMPDDWSGYKDDEWDDDRDPDDPSGLEHSGE